MRESDPRFESGYPNRQRDEWNSFDGDNPTDGERQRNAGADWYDRNQRRREAHLQHYPRQNRFGDRSGKMFDSDINRNMGKAYPYSWREGSRFSDREQDYRGGYWDRASHAYHDGDGREEHYRPGLHETWRGTVYGNPESREYADYSGGSTEQDYSVSDSDLGSAPDYDNRFGRGAFAGIGPKNYQRADSRIQEDVCDRLTAHAALDPSQMEVKVVEGEVILTGEVPTRRMKRLAEDIAEGIPGVRDVNNQLHVQHPQSNNPAANTPQSHYVELHGQTRPM